MKIWDWLNGKKTLIGTALLLVAAVIRMSAPDNEWAVLCEQAGILLGGSIAAVGIGHKVVKGRQ